MHIPTCQLGPIGYLPPLYGHARVRAECACGYTIGAYDESQLRNLYADHLATPVPPADVLAQDVPTVADVQRWPRFFIGGPGQKIAERVRCPHDYALTSSCPGCDADQERADEEARYA